MKHLKKFNEMYMHGGPEQEKLIGILSSFNIKNWRLGRDHLGNDNVFLFNKDGYDFEIYNIPSDAYHVNYGKDGRWIENFNTMDLESSLLQIFKTSEFPE